MTQKMGEFPALWIENREWQFRGKNKVAQYLKLSKENVCCVVFIMLWIKNRHLYSRLIAIDYSAPSLSHPQAFYLQRLVTDENMTYVISYKVQFRHHTTDTKNKCIDQVKIKVIDYRIWDWMDKMSTNRTLRCVKSIFTKAPQ